MVSYKKADYKIVKFQRSSLKTKKYTVILMNKKTQKQVKVNFGAIKKDGTPYQQYEDRTPLKLFSKYDHKDKDRRNRYRDRHKNDNLQDYSPGYFSWKYLWT